jgi:hypothetical protein
MPPTSVPGSVAKFWNRYQTHGNPVFLGRPIRGKVLLSRARTSDQQRLNPGPVNNGINHVSIVSEVKAQLIGLLIS